MLYTREIFEKLDRSGPSRSVDANDLLFDLGFGPHFLDDDVSDAFEKHVEAHPVVQWYCTDTYVGVLAYWLDGEPFALSSQTARKNSVNFEFVSAEVVEKARKIVIDIYAQHIMAASVKYLNGDQVFSDDSCYDVGDGDQLLTNEGLYRGDKATVIERYGYYSNFSNGCIPTKETLSGMWSKVKVRLEDGSEHLIGLNEFRIPIPLIS